jgi:hypothetical protein
VGDETPVDLYIFSIVIGFKDEFLEKEFLFFIAKKGKKGVIFPSRLWEKAS